MFADIRTLVYLFVTWKLLLLCIAFASPGPGYDTSTHLLMLHSESANDTVLARFIEKLVSKLVRWDALYFVSVAQRGYLFEQEWAWGWGYTTFLKLVSQGWFRKFCQTQRLSTYQSYQMPRLHHSMRKHLLVFLFPTSPISCPL